MTQKIRIQNVKTGKIAEVTQFAWNTLKKGGKSKFYEVLNKPSEPVKFSAPTVTKPVVDEPKIVEPKVDELESDYVDQVEGMDDIESNGVESKPVKKGRKPKN
jgi:hypothetical protein